MREQYEFVSSMAEVNRVTANEKKKKKDDNAQRDLEKSAPAAAKKLEKKKRDIDSLYVGEIEAILFQVYNVRMQGKSKLRKPDYKKKLQEEMGKSIGKYEIYVSSLTNATQTETEREETPESAASILSPRTKHQLRWKQWQWR